MKKQRELLTQAAWHVASGTAPRLRRTLPPRSQDVMLCLYQHPSAGGGVISGGSVSVITSRVGFLTRTAHCGLLRHET